MLTGYFIVLCKSEIDGHKKKCTVVLGNCSDQCFFFLNSVNSSLSLFLPLSLFLSLSLCSSLPVFGYNYLAVSFISSCTFSYTNIICRHILISFCSCCCCWLCCWLVVYLFSFLSLFIYFLFFLVLQKSKRQLPIQTCIDYKLATLAFRHFDGSLTSVSLFKARYISAVPIAQIKQ